MENEIKNCKGTWVPESKHLIGYTKSHLSSLKEQVSLYWNKRISLYEAMKYSIECSADKEIAEVTAHYNRLVALLREGLEPYIDHKNICDWRVRIAAALRETPAQSLAKKRLVVK